ncbi:MAG: type II toxin-antitoxin system RelE/ParE family toxin [Dehalococcoidia bacterium]
MAISWTDEALADLQTIFDSLAETSPRFAGRALERISGQVKQIERFPMMGRKVEELGYEQIREILALPYRVIYRVVPSGVEILTVAYAANRL